ncbi:MAG: MBOAT family protein [Lachnospiraceae bacterium]|nr:MBOAT family protein [Lachnospiraceae bacterium]
MLFNTAEYILFFFIAVFIYFIIPGKLRGLWLLAASCWFYANWNRTYLLLLLFSAAVSYLTGCLLAKAHGAVRRAALAAGILLQLGLLIYFKYALFLLQAGGTILRLFHASIPQETVSFASGILLPVGISFFTFKSLSYMIDVYRGTIEAERSPLACGLYIAFFPQLAAGPIDRPADLIPQLKNLALLGRPDHDRITGGMTIMLWGFFMKMVIADRIALFADTVFDNYFLYGTAQLLTAAVAYALQIYCDFAGYSLISIGTAKVLGISVKDNFNAPYMAMSVREFWRRWHISLSSWFRDYVYIPLGGSRCSRLRKWLNIMITMAVSGLWHGAGGRFILWGALHGIYQILEDVLTKPLAGFLNRIHAKTASFSYRFGKRLLTFAAVDLAWIFFRCSSFKDALLYIYRMFTGFQPAAFVDGSLYSFGLSVQEFHILICSLALLAVIDHRQYRDGRRIDALLASQSLWFRWLFLIGLFTAVWVFGIYGPAFSGSAFIYLQF